MNLIICNEDCRHKSDGYCALNNIASLTSSKASKCGYYEMAGLKEGIANVKPIMPDLDLRPR